MNAEHIIRNNIFLSENIMVLGPACFDRTAPKSRQTGGHKLGIDSFVMPSHSIRSLRKLK